MMSFFHKEGHRSKADFAPTRQREKDSNGCAVLRTRDLDLSRAPVLWTEPRG